MAFYKVVYLFGTHVAETILASVHARAQQQAGRMNASDTVKIISNYIASRGPSTYEVLICRGAPIFLPAYYLLADGKVLIGSVVHDYLVCVLVSPAQDDILRLYGVKGESLSPQAP